MEEASEPKREFSSFCEESNQKLMLEEEGEPREDIEHVLLPRSHESPRPPKVGPRAPRSTQECPRGAHKRKDELFLRICKRLHDRTNFPKRKQKLLHRRVAEPLTLCKETVLHRSVNYAWEKYKV